MPLKIHIAKDVGLICFIAILLAIGLGLYKFFEEKEKQDWNNQNSI